MSIGSHQSAAMGKDEWLTPPEVLRSLGQFDLDPCSPINRPWPTAERHYTVLDNGLTKPQDAPEMAQGTYTPKYIAAPIRNSCNCSDSSSFSCGSSSDCGSSSSD